MTFFAIYRLVLAFQFESGHVVVEIFRYTGNPERFFIMAIGALIAEFAFVDIFMAGRAIIGLYTFPILENISGFGSQIVAFFAPHLAMTAF